MLRIMSSVVDAEATTPPRRGELPCVLDVEASGLGRHSYPLEVGFVLPDGAASCTLVRPQPDWTHWDAGAERLHGITREQALLHGRSVQAVATLLNQRLGGMVVYSDGWGHDYAWLAKLFDAAGMRAQFRLEHLRVLLDEAQQSRFDAALAWAREELRAPRHRASNDARALQVALRRVLGEPTPG